MIEDYTRRILSRDTLLVRVLGVYMLQSIDNYSVDLIIMESIAAPGLYPKYLIDLKGSTYNRTEASSKILNGSFSFYKDIDFLENVVSLDLEPSESLRFLQMIEKDITMLQLHGIMDYSLFGAYYTDQQIPNNKYCFRQQGTDNFYALGLIDILQEYNTSKRCEHWIKRLLSKADAAELSSVNPQIYAERLMEMCRQILEV